MYFRLTAETGEEVVVEANAGPDTRDGTDEARARAVAVRHFHRCWPWLVGDGAVVQRVLGDTSVPYVSRTWEGIGPTYYASNARPVQNAPTMVGQVDDDPRLDFPR